MSPIWRWKSGELIGGKVPPARRWSAGTPLFMGMKQQGGLGGEWPNGRRGSGPNRRSLTDLRSAPVVGAWSEEAPVNVQELIAALRGFDASLPVLFWGPDGELEPVLVLLPAEVLRCRERIALADERDDRASPVVLMVCGDRGEGKY